MPTDEHEELYHAIAGKSPDATRFRALRLHPQVGATEIPFDLNPIPWYSRGFRNTDTNVRPSSSLQYAAGDYYLQDAGSMLAIAACEIEKTQQKPLLVCDLCSAPGGKASALLESIGEGFLLANEPIKSRVPPLAFNLARTGIPRYAISSLDPEELAQRLPNTFDLILVDAPCSGQALLSHGKQSVSALSSKQIEHSALRQNRILDAAARCLCPGGRLVYSTCTFAEAENEAQIRRLIKRGDFESAPVASLNEYESTISGTYRLWPHRHNCAGSFAAALVKRSDESREESSSHSTHRQTDSEEVPDDLEQWFAPIQNMKLKMSRANIWSIPVNAPDWVWDIASSGPELAYRTGQTWKPSHEAALRREPFTLARDQIEVDDETARQFTSGNTIACNQPGWQVVTWRSRPLGWIKGSQRPGTTTFQGKNQLPKHARQTISSPIVRPI